jgi:iron complex outermembrane receptor protein
MQHLLTRLPRKSLCHFIVLNILIVTNIPFAQSSDLPGSLTGVVTDPAGAGLLGARISVVHKLTGETHHALADSQGRYTLNNLPNGPYTVEASATNFDTVTKEVQITSAGQTAADFQLPLSSMNVSVTVTESAKAELEKVPGSIAVITPLEIEHSRAYDLKDVLAFIPGVFANPRYGADETQFSIRGSGLRANYHERSVNIFINGMPYQDADGFSDFESLELMSTQRVEVWKGANALRFGGNSMGGAVNFVTQDGFNASPVQVNLMGGSYGLFKGQVSTGGRKGRFDYYLSVSDTEFEGYRDHSQQGRQRLYGNFGIKLSENTKLRFDVIYANIAEKLPGSLTREEFLSNPRQAEETDVLYDWGRFIDFTRVGVGLNHRFDSRHEIDLIAYGQYRNMDHPIFETLDQDARNFGGELRYRFVGTLGGKPNRFVIGFTPQIGNVGERRFETLLGGGRGSRTNVFGTRARNYGFYFENQLDVHSRFTLIAGGRADYAVRQYLDEFKAFGTDHSDRRDYSAFSPKLGFVYRPMEDVQLFGNLSRSYEVPLLLELTSYNPAVPGFLPLAPQDTWQFELGTRGQIGTRANWELAFFDAEIDDEIINVNLTPFPGAFFTIPSFRSAPNTRHSGIEVGNSLLLKQGLFGQKDRLAWRTSYTWSRFRFLGDADYGDNYIPGAPRHLFRNELRYDQGSGLWFAPNIDWSPASYFVNSANTATNEQYAIVNFKVGYDWRNVGFFFEAALRMAGRNGWNVLNSPTTLMSRISWNTG